MRYVILAALLSGCAAMNQPHYDTRIAIGDGIRERVVIDKRDTENYRCYSGRIMRCDIWGSQAECWCPN